MEVYISESTPVLRIMTDISEIKKIGPEGDVAANESPHYGNHKDCKGVCNGQINPISRRKPLNPLLGCNPYRAKINHGGSFHPVYSNTQSNVSNFTKRVLSAKLLKFKQLQNQLFETQSQLNEVMNENKVLKAVHKRQDNALKKYEGGHEQLPQLIKSHNEEMRILSAKYKQLKSNYRDLENKLKQRDSDLFNLREQHKHLVKLSKDKHLGDREKLTKRLEELERLVKEQQDKIQVLNRKVILEGKNYRHQLTQEINKHKETQNQLNAALEAFENLKYSVEGKGRYVTFQKKFPHVGGYSVQQPLNLPGPSRVSIRQSSTQGLDQSETTFMNGTETNSTVSSVAYTNQCRETSSEDRSDDTHNKDDMNAAASVYPPSGNSEETWRVEKLSGFLRKEMGSNNISRYKLPLNYTESIKLGKVKLKEKSYIRNMALPAKLKNGKTSSKESNSESNDYSISDKSKIKTKERKTKEPVLYPSDSQYEKADQEHSESQVGSSNEGAEFQSPSTASLSDTFINDTRNQFKEDEDWNLSHYESGNNDNATEDNPGRRNSAEWFNIDMDNEFKEYLMNSSISLSKPNDKIEDNVDFIEKKLLSLDVNKNRSLEEDCPKKFSEESCCDESNSEIVTSEIKKNRRSNKDLLSNTPQSDNFVKLDETKKADLLKALYEIDKDEKGEDFAEKAGINAFTFSSVRGKDYFEEGVDMEKAKKKSHVMKELFG